MNNTGQGGVGILGFFFLIAVFVVLWAFILAPMFSNFGDLAIAGGNLSGIEAFLAGNINLWVFIGLLLGTLATVYYYGGAR